MCAPSPDDVPRTMLITGANGFIGSRLATYALRQGYQVKTLTRTDWAAHPPVSPHHRYFGSLPGQIPAAAFEGVDVVVHCAAYVGSEERPAHAINVEGSRLLARRARQAGVETFIFLSSQSARADALSAYGQTKFAAEQELLAQEGMNVIVLRPGLVTGPGTQGLFQRLCRVVQRYPLLPLLGGGRAIVQPIHVDDLCTAILRCDQQAGDLDRTILQLGLPGGVSLKEFLQTIAVQWRGTRKWTLPLPLWPVEVALGLAEWLHLPLPIHRGNLRALKIVQPMPTEADLSRLNLRLRPLREMVQVESEGPASLPLPERAVRVLLVGAGRIGLVHAVTLSRLSGAILAGVVDAKRGATRFLQGMGLTAPTYASLQSALDQARPDAVIIATPVASHLPLTRVCLQHGLAVMVEKPLAASQAQLAEYEQLARAFPDCPIQVGYVLPRNPQVAGAIQRLQAGEFGKVIGFVGVTLLSFIHEGGSKRWEVHKSISGGGSLINAGGHVLSLIRAALGDPDAVEAQSLKLHSSEVEDSFVGSFHYPTFSGKHYCSWSMGGYPRQENLLSIQTERGRLLLTGSVAVFLGADGTVEVSHQLDFSVGFNIAADYAGAGFTTELNDLQQAARTRRPAPMSLHEAIPVERLLFQLYESASEVTTFTDLSRPIPPMAPASLHLAARGKSSGPIPAPVSRLLDVRELPLHSLEDYWRQGPRETSWAGYVLTPAQLRALAPPRQEDKRLWVTVPDFLAQSRLLASGRHTALLKELGVVGIGAAARAALPRLLRDRHPTFWVAALGLLGAGLHAVPRAFAGTLLLHGYLTDFAFSLRRLDLLDQMLRTCRRLRPRARVGFHTNMAQEAVNALALLETPVDDVSVLTSPGAVAMAETLQALRQARPPGTLRVTAEVGLAPALVHRLALQEPRQWAFSADALLLGAGAEPALAHQRLRAVAEEWSRVFPGLPFPEEVLG